MKTVSCIAFRKDKGPSGGPGGVLHVMKRLLNDEYDNISFEYYFMPDRLPGWIFFLGHLLGILGFRKENIWAALYATIFLAPKKSALYIVHDIGTATGLAIMGKKYLLVYHQQGTPYAEIRSFRAKRSLRYKIGLTIIEKIIFSKAYAVAFPSQGALDLLKETSIAFLKWNKTTKEKKTFVLYNTILTDPSPPSQQDLDLISSIPIEGRLFLSVGALSEAKGIDQVPALLKELKNTGVKFTWIAVGRGKLEARVRLLLKEYDLLPNSTLITKPLQHAALLKLFEQSDYYIMLHRTSIFDFATLEAMRAGCTPLLSDIGGNRDFCKNNNVIFTRNNHFSDAAKLIHETDLNEMRRKNIACFDTYFSPEKFRESYLSTIKTLLE